MQILANALPGFRDLRAPAVAGYAWLLFAWLLVQPDLDTRPHGAAAGALYDLGGDVGRLGVAVAVSVVAYFVGSLSQMLSTPLRTLWDAVLEVLWRRLPAGLDDTIGVPPSPGTPEDEEIEQILVRTRAAVAVRLDMPPDHPRFPDFDAAQARAHAEARAELELPATLLVGKEPELFAEVDRLRAEGELRLAVVPPFVALVVLLAVMASPWCLVALAPLVALLDQGVRTLNSSRQLVVDAKARNLVPSQALERFRRWAEVVEARPEDALRPDPPPRARQSRRRSSHARARATRLMEPLTEDQELPERLATLHRLGQGARTVLRRYGEGELGSVDSLDLGEGRFPPSGSSASPAVLEMMIRWGLLEPGSQDDTWRLSDDGVEVARLLIAPMPDEPKLRAEIGLLRQRS